MSVRNTLWVLFRKYPLFRISCVVALCLLTIGTISLITVETRKIPAILTIQPAVGSAGDIMTIRGENFGTSRDASSYVEIGGSRLTANGYLRWSDSEIRLVIPPNVQDGLVIVATKTGRSTPVFFANEADIPVAVPPNTQTALPTITSVSPAGGSCGTLLTISGMNFGTIRNNGLVIFTANRDDAMQATVSASTKDDAANDFQLQFIPANESNYDYEYWSDSEIHVRIPDGATNGPLYVQTEKGNSNYYQAEIKQPVGTKSYTGRRTYILQMSEDVEDADSHGATSVTFRIPRPAVTASQPIVQLTECYPTPVLADYKNTIIHQTDLIRGKKIRFTQSFVVSVYAVQTEIDAKKIRPFSEKSRLLYVSATQQDALIQSKNESVVAKAKEIVGKETNPYLQAKLVYDYMLSHYDLPAKLRRENKVPIDMLRTERGDAYDFAVLYTTLVRALGIPCLPISGMLVDADLHAQPHWWCEFYLENIGWIPVDIALAKGIPYKTFKQPADAPVFYFGNLDSQHVMFSRGWNEVKPALINSKIVQRQKSYAFQSIWEESSAGNVNYSSLWNDPVVKGIY